MKFRVLPEGLKKEQKSFASVVEHITGAQACVDEVSNDLAAIGLQELEKNIGMLYAQLGKEKLLVDVLSDTLARICQKYEQVEAMLANAGLIFDKEAVLMIASANKYVGDFNGRLGSSVGDGSALSMADSKAAMTVGVSVPMSESYYNVSYWDDENMGLAEMHKQVSGSNRTWDITNNMALKFDASQSVSDIYRYPGSEESLNGSMELSYTASQLDLSTATNVGWLGLSAGVDVKMFGVDSVLGASAGWENANGEFDPHFCLGAYASGSLLEAGAHGSVSVAGVDFEMSVSTGVSASVGAYVTYHDGNIQAHFMDADFKIALNEHTDAFEHLIYDMRPTSFDDYLFIEGVKTDLADICYFAAGLSESQ